MIVPVLHCIPSRGDGGDGHRDAPFGGVPDAGGDDLAYRVEIWDEQGGVIDQVVAVAANASIGYAAYYATVRAYPGCMITLRHKGVVLSRWPSRTH